MGKRAYKRCLSIFLAAAMFISGFVAGIDTSTQDVKAAGSAGVTYTTHVQKKGWLNWSVNGATSGTSGQSLRIEGLKIKLTNADYTGSIQYRAYCQSYGWKPWVSNGAMAGTSGEAKRVEAIQVKLTGNMATNYDVYYRVYCQSYGWLDWAKNGATAGTSSLAKRVEAVQVKLVKKNGAAPGSVAKPYVHPMVKYRTHVQTYGWQSYVTDGAMSGTSGQAKRLEGINIALVDKEYSGSIQYRTHVQSYGWMSWVSDGAMSGTSGQAKRLEAIEIKLTGEMANKYDVYYRVHSQTYGWLGWAKNGASSGTSGLGKRLEAIQIQVLPKGSAAPGSTANAYVQKVTTVAATGVTLNATSATLTVGGTKALTATVSPSNATNKTVTWTSSNTTVATVSSTGVVTAKKAGSATITAKTSNGKTATCKVTVNSSSTGKTDSDQGDQEALYNALFNINNKVKIDLDIPNDQLKLMQSDYKKGDNETYRMCTMTLTVNNKSYKFYEVGVRLKGNTSRVDIYNGTDLTSRNLIHFKISFKETWDDEVYGTSAKVWASDAERKARKKRTVATLKTLELKWNRNLDQTYVGNLYVNQMYRDLTGYAQNTSLANVHFGGYNYGVYTMYEPVDENFLTRYFGAGNDEGDLYKCQWGTKAAGSGNDWSGATYTKDTLNSMSPEEVGKKYIYELKTNKKKSDQSSLKKLINTLNSNSSKATFSSVVDANYFVKYAAVAWFVGNPDDFRNNYNNHYVYFNNTNKLAYIIPYDNDRVLGMTTSNKDMTTYSPYAGDTALQGGQSSPFFNNSIVGRTSNYYTEYTAALKKVYESKWMDYNNYLTYYNAAKKNYESVAVPDSNVKLYVKDENKTYSSSLLKFSEGNGKINYGFGYMTVKDYFKKIKARYVESMRK